MKLISTLFFLFMMGALSFGQSDATGYIHYFGDPTKLVSCVNIEVKDLDTEAIIYNSETDSDGKYEFNFGTTSKFRIEAYADDNISSGIDVIDAVLIKNFNAKNIELNNFQRLAADVNNDGEVNEDDDTFINDEIIPKWCAQDMVTNIWECKPWLFIPKFYTSQDAANPDFVFAAEFWSPTRSHGSKYLPFDATYKHTTGSIYCYNLDPAECFETWRNGIVEFDLNDNCYTPLYNMWAVKIADVDGSASTNICTPISFQGGGTSQKNLSTLHTLFIEENKDKRRKRRSFSNLIITANTEVPIIAYQFNIAIDSLDVELPDLEQYGLQDHFELGETSVYNIKRDDVLQNEYLNIWMEDLNESVPKVFRNEIVFHQQISLSGNRELAELIRISERFNEVVFVDENYKPVPVQFTIQVE